MTQSGNDLETPLPRIVSVVGLKKSGKTTVVTALLSELRSRGHRVGSIKTMEHAALFPDQEGTDTRLHADAGAEVVVALRSGQSRSLRDIVRLFPHSTEFLICEGMADRNTSQLIVLCLRSMEDLAETLAVRGIQTGSVLAVSGVAAGALKGSVPGARDIPVFDATDVVQRSSLVDLIIEKAYPGA